MSTGEALAFLTLLVTLICGIGALIPKKKGDQLTVVRWFLLLLLFALFIGVLIWGVLDLTTNSTSTHVPAPMRHQIEIGGEKIWSDVRTLSLENKKINDLTPLLSLTNLTHLYLRDNQITDIGPLQSLTNLTHLSLHNNQIADITPLQSLTSLYHLELGYNQITDISPLESLFKLKYLYLTSPLSQAQVDEFQKALPNCVIVF